MPSEYKSLPLGEEITFKKMKRALLKIKEHNKDAFHIFYGGEPTLRKNLLEKLVRFCNSQQIYYTIISNCTPMAQKVLEDIDKKYSIKGLSASVDPVLECKSDRGKKTNFGLSFLNKMSHVPDRVAEITITKEGIPYVVPLIEQLTNADICSSVTLIDIAKTPYYDFSNVTSYKAMPDKDDIKKLVDDLMRRDDLLIHMKDEVLPSLIKYYPTNFIRCFKKSIHNLTIDSDGSMRLCLRIRGTHCPNYSIENVFDSHFKLTNSFKNAINLDMDLCKGCNWTCPMMSGMCQNSDDITHKSRR